MSSEIPLKNEGRSSGLEEGGEDHDAATSTPTTAAAAGSCGNSVHDRDDDNGNDNHDNGTTGNNNNNLREGVRNILHQTYYEEIVNVMNNPTIDDENKLGMVQKGMDDASDKILNLVRSTQESALATTTTKTTTTDREKVKEDAMMKSFDDRLTRIESLLKVQIESMQGLVKTASQGKDDDDDDDDNDNDKNNEWELIPSPPQQVEQKKNDDGDDNQKKPAAAVISNTSTNQEPAFMSSDDAWEEEEMKLKREFEAWEEDARELKYELDSQEEEAINRKCELEVWEEIVMERKCELDARKEELMKRKCGHDASSIVQPRKKRGKLPTPTKIHMKLRAAYDAATNWWNAMEEKHGEGKAHLIYGIIAKYLNQQEFPADGGKETTKNEEFLRLAKEGWHLFKKNEELIKQHPKESAEQLCQNGVWTMCQADP